MDSDPIESSPALKRQKTPDGYHPAHHDTIATLPLNQHFMTSDYPSSPPAPRATQPTQILATPPPPQLSDILVPGTSPLTKFTSAPNVNTAQFGVFTRMAPPGTYLSVPQQPSQPSNPKPRQNENFQGLARTAPPPWDIPRKAPLDSDEDTQQDIIHLSDSEDELSRPERANIPPSEIIDPLQSLARFRNKISPYTLLSQAHQNSIPTKRTTGDVINGTAKAFSIPQSGPSRAVPVGGFPSGPTPREYTTEDYHKLQACYPMASAHQRRQAMSLTQNNLRAAMKVLRKQYGDPKGVIDLTSSDDDLIMEVAPIKAGPPKPTAKRQLFGERSMAKKLNQVNGDQNDAPRRRRLIKGPRERSSSPDSTIPAVTTKHPIIKRNVIESDADSEDSPKAGKKQKITIDLDLSDDDADESDEEVAPLGKNLLAFFNSCDAKQLADIANCSEDLCEIIIASRPFRNLTQVRAVQDLRAPAKVSKGRGASARKPIGERIVDVSEQMWAGLEAIDRLVAHCKELGTSLKKDMNKLGLDVNGSELSLTNFARRADSGVGSSPSSGEDNPVRHTKPQAIGKPSIMSPDVTLKDYQIVGINWLNQLYKQNVSGILADDMGLGKTCQVISFLSHLYETGVTGLHLICVPGSTLENWLREFEKFSPQLEVFAYHGSQAERFEMQEFISNGTNSINVVITTYDMATSKTDNSFLRSMRPVTCIYDEGHMLKNSKSQRYISLMRIKTPWRLLLTGTPLQNNLQELISILGFIMPDIFGDNMEDLGYIFKHRAKTTEDDHAKLLSAQRVSRARSMMAPFVLRRKKEQVLKDLPPKIRRVEYCEMTPRQKMLYDEYAAIHQTALENSKKGIASDPRNYMMDHRKAAIHPLMFRSIYGNDDIETMHRKIPAKGKYRGWSQIKVKEEMEWWSDFKIHQTCLEYPELNGYALDDNEWMDSGKVTKLVELLKKNDSEGNRTLLFSQFTSVLDILESVLETENITFCRFDGTTPIAQRQDYIDAFYEDESIKVFMLSTRSGGTGINLACANRVIIFDGSFNPQDDIQAENRAHRVGQTREVEVVRLVTRGTIEEKIHALGKSKLALDQLVAGEAGAEDVGMNLVEKMLVDELEGVKPETPLDSGDQGEEADDRTEKTDVKDQFLAGLQSAGLDVKA